MIVGGAQENTLLTVRGLLERGHEVALVTGPTRGPEGKLLERSVVPGLRVIELPSLVRELNPWEDTRAYRDLVDLFRGERYDVVHTHSSKAGIVGRLAARKARVPYVVHTVHGQAFHPYERWWRNALFIRAERLAARRCDRIYAVCQAMIDQCVAARIAPREKYQVVYSGMDLESFISARREPELRRQLGIPDAAPVIGKIARLFELKGHDHLLAAAEPVVREFPEVRFLLVGDGALREPLQAEARRRGMERNFVFAGLVSPTEVPRYVAQMDALVHLSLREGLPRTVVQALAHGIPAVGFSLDGTPEVILPGETGFLCQAGDVPAVSTALLALLRDPVGARELGARGQALVKARFAWQTMVTVLETDYERGLRLQRQPLS